MAKRYDWGMIREEYVAGSDEVTYRSLAAKYGPAFESIGRRGSRERWPEQRSTYRQQVVNKTRNRASTKEAEVRVRHIQIAEALIKPAMKRLKKLKPKDLTVAELRHYLKTATEIES